MGKLTKHQRECVIGAAQDAEVKELYASRSFTGYSLTLRSASVANNGRSYTDHVLSVVVPDVFHPEWEKAADYQEAKRGFEQKVAEATALFDETRREK